MKGLFILQINESPIESHLIISKVLIVPEEGFIYLGIEDTSPTPKALIDFRHPNGTAGNLNLFSIDESTYRTLLKKEEVLFSARIPS